MLVCIYVRNYNVDGLVKYHTLTTCLQSFAGLLSCSTSLHIVICIHVNLPS